jgi:RimJ/RimL family protein N-acetyltransferase
VVTAPREIQLRIHPAVADFRELASAVYRRDPIATTTELTVLRRITADADPAPLLFTVWRDTRVVGAGLRTPPFPLLCTGVALGDIAEAAVGLAELRIVVPGVRGPADAAEAFAASWSASTGAGSKVNTRERLYRLDALAEPVGADGYARAAGPSDIELLADWLVQFNREATNDHHDRAATIQFVLATQALGDEYVLWTANGRSISLACVRMPIAGVSRIGPVYTPTAERGKGYGSAVTAAAVRWALQHGATEVVLFTDLANPTSNHIYREIGFRPVRDYARIDFEEPS